MEKKICSWCNELIESDQPTSTAFDGEVMHFICATQADDDEPYIPD